MLRRLYSLLARQLIAPGAVCVYRNALSTLCLASCILQFVALLGTSLPVSVAILATIAMAVTAAAAQANNVRRITLPGLSAGALLQMTLAAWMVASPWILEAIDGAIARPGLISLTSTAWTSAVLFAVAVIGLGLPTFVVTILANDPDEEPTKIPQRLPLVFLAVAVGLAVWMLGLAQIMGPYYCGVAAAGLGLALAVACSIRRTGTQPVDLETGPPRAAKSSPLMAPTSHGMSAWLRPALSAALAAGWGGYPAALDRLLQQLMPGTVCLTCSEVIGLCLGLAAGLWMSSRCGSTVSADRVKHLTAYGAAAWGVGLVAGFPLLISASLWLNSCVSSPTLLLMARGTIAGFVFFPLGAAAAVCLASATTGVALRIRLGIGGWLCAAGFGYFAVLIWALNEYPLGHVMVGLGWCTVAAATPVGPLTARELFPRGRQRALAGGAVLAVALAPLWHANFDPQQSAKVLFNSNAAFAYLNGFDAKLLPALDDGRLVATATGQRGIFTVWRFGGHQLQIRENGIPRGVVSTDDVAFPRYVPETLQSALPLILHEKPQKLLLLGLGCGESLSAGLMFPVSEITCLESDAGLVRVLRETVAGESGTHPLQDERVALSVCDPALGLNAVPSGFDVIVSSPEHLAMPRTQACLTTEFYQRAARKLSPQGIFCQRVQFADFGPRPLRTIIRTVESVFRDVIVLEAAPGDFLIAATSSDRGLIRDGLVSRFESPHVRALFAQSGIDWTMALNLAASDRERLTTFIDQEAGQPNTAAGGRLSLSLPREVMRWGPKMQELYVALEKSRSRLLAWVENEADSPVLLRRLAEVQGQFELMTKFSDQYWAYRASLRDQVKEKPRSQIEQVSATDEGRRMHPEDRRRLRYFQVLGRAVKSGTAADIERLLEFAVPYDPLISYFVHEEAAELYARSHEPDPAQELRHRLHATFFASPKDASLHNVVKALKLLREHPGSEPDPRRRWDDLNALLQALKVRWDARAGIHPSDVKEALHDIDTTLLAAEQSFQVLDRLADEAGLPREFGTNRRSVLEKTLIRPVKAYQQQLLPHLHERQAQREEGVDPADGAPSVEESDDE